MCEPEGASVLGIAATPLKLAGAVIAAVAAFAVIGVAVHVLLGLMLPITIGAVAVAAATAWAVRWLYARHMVLAWERDPQQKLQAAPAPITLAAESYRPLEVAAPLAIGPARRVVPGVVVREAGPGQRGWGDQPVGARRGSGDGAGTSATASPPSVISPIAGTPSTVASATSVAANRTAASMDAGCSSARSTCYSANMARRVSAAWLESRHSARLRTHRSG